jgi:enamine deaminase RidA (YjgF/YER057c/UK114 family)
MVARRFTKEGLPQLWSAVYRRDALGAGPHDIVMLRAYLTDLRPETQETVMALLLPFQDGAQPSIIGVGVAALATPELQLEIERTVRVP